MALSQDFLYLQLPLVDIEMSNGCLLPKKVQTSSQLTVMNATMDQFKHPSNNQSSPSAM